jgi:hypothetical protein
MLQPVLHRFLDDRNQPRRRVAIAHEFRDRNHRLRKSRRERHSRFSVRRFSPAARCAGEFRFCCLLRHFQYSKKVASPDYTDRGRRGLLMPRSDWRGKLVRPNIVGHHQFVKRIFADLQRLCGVVKAVSDVERLRASLVGCPIRWSAICVDFNGIFACCCFVSSSSILREACVLTLVSRVILCDSRRKR